MPSKRSSRDFQWAAMASICSVRSRKVFPVKPPVWVERQAVGSGQHWTPMAARVGRTMVKEHRPKQLRSWTAATRGRFFTGRPPLSRRAAS